MAGKGPTAFYEIEVVLESGAYLPEGWSPGRVFAVPGSCPLWQLAEAIDLGFGRWDLAHERDFTIGGRRIPGSRGSRGAARLDSLGLVKEDTFEYEFDLGDSWVHQCRVRNVAPDVDELWDGWKPSLPTAIEGWGNLPDQYGRAAWSDDGDED